MDQKAFLALTAMLNAFPQGSGNPDLTMGTYEAVLAAVSSQAIIDAAQRFASGDVPDQSLTFAPSVAEFVKQARFQASLIPTRNSPRLAPPIRALENSSFLMRREKKLAEYADRQILHTDINFDQWKRLSKTQEVPVGAVWVSSLGTIYGPKPKSA